MYGCERWIIKKAEHWRTDAFELWYWRRLLRVFSRSKGTLDCKELKPVNPKGNQLWIFIRRTDAEAEAPILGPPVSKSQLIGKDPDAVKDWRQKEKEMTEDEMVVWPYRLNGHEFEQTLGDSKSQGNLACCSQWDCRVGHDLATEHQHNWITFFYFCLLTRHDWCINYS